MSTAEGLFRQAELLNEQLLEDQDANWKAGYYAMEMMRIIAGKELVADLELLLRSDPNFFWSWSQYTANVVILEDPNGTALMSVLLDDFDFTWANEYLFRQNVLAYK
jgi:hypothetical protein